MLQIVNNVKKLTLNAEGQPIEAMLTKNLKHMGITRTLAYAWWVATDRGGTEGEKQCWMIMEYCDRGNIVVRTKLLPDHSKAPAAVKWHVALGLLQVAFRCVIACMLSHSLGHADLGLC